MTAQSLISSYRDIISTASHIKNLFNVHDQFLVSANLIGYEHVVLPEPLDITSRLFTFGASETVLERLNDAYRRAALKLRGVSQDNLRKALQQTCGRSASSDSEFQSKLIAAFTTRYEEKISALADGVINQVQERFKGIEERKSTPRQTKPVFNAHFIPILDACFSKNSLPSKADKILLAEKSGMSYKQINVWFQNHRNRTKINPITDASNRRQRFTTCRRVDEDGPDHVSAELAVKGWARTSSSSATLIDEDQPFKNSPPSYAFPTVYPPSIFGDQDPFSCCFGDFSIFAKPCWDRRPLSVLQVQQCVVDLDSLTSAFEKLQIGDNVQQPLQKKSNRASQGSQTFSKSSGSDVTSPYTVRPLRAPLMSLIRNFASRVVHRSGRSSDDIQRSQRKVVAAPTVESGAQSVQRKTRRRQAPASRGSAVSAKQNSAPSACPSTEPSSFSAPNPSVATAFTLTMDQPTKIKKSTRKSSSSQRIPVASTLKRSKGHSAPIAKATEPLPESPIVHPSPTASVDSLPSLSYSSESSSASTCSQSPTTSFGVLPDNDLLPSLDPYQHSGSSLTLPSAPTVFEDFPSQMFPPSDISFDFSKGPLDYTSNLGLPSYPSYSDSFDTISQGLQSSPDFPPPVLTLDSISFAV